VAIGDDVSGFSKDPLRLASGWFRKDDEPSFVVEEEWYTVYRCFSRLLCCEIWTATRGRLEVSKEGSILVKAFLRACEESLYDLRDEFSLVSWNGEFIFGTPTSVAVRSLTEAGRLFLRLCRLGLLLDDRGTEARLFFQASMAAVLTFAFGCWCHVY